MVFQKLTDSDKEQITIFSQTFDKKQFAQIRAMIMRGSTPHDAKTNRKIPAKYQDGDEYDVKGYNKEYGKHNSDKIKELKKAYRTKTILCPCCDAMINRNNRFQHNKSKKHVNNSSSSSSSSTSQSSTE